MKNLNWFSLHVFLSDQALALKFLREWLTPKSQQLLGDQSVASWFFIRYWDGGPHFRLRFALNHADVASALQVELADIAPSYASPTPVTREQYYGQHQFDGIQLDPNTLQWFSEGAVVPINYEPETVRYGGSVALKINEQLFQVSSEIALRLCRDNRSHQQHLISAMLLMASSYLAFNRNFVDAYEFFDGYAKYWRDYSADTAKSELAAGDKADVALIKKVENLSLLSSHKTKGNKSLEQLWAQAITQAVSKFLQIYQDSQLVVPSTGEVAITEGDYKVSVALMLASQIHMMNNRLGLVPAQECYLARLLANIFRELIG